MDFIEKPAVSITKCSDYSYDLVRSAVRESIDAIGGIKRFVKPGRKVLLKPNLLLGKKPEKGVNTHHTIVRAVAEMVLEADGVPFIGDSPAMGSTTSVSKRCGILGVARDLKVRVEDFNESVPINLENGGRFKKLEIARNVLEADVIINLPKLKTHGLMYLTVCVKNTFGYVVGMRKGQWHLKTAHNMKGFAGMLAALHTTVRPTLNVVDAIQAMQGNGPSSGTTKDIGLIIASDDGFAADRVVQEIISCPEGKLYTTVVAREENLAQVDMNKMEILGASIEDVRISDFEFTKHGGPQDQRTPWPLNRILKDSLTPKPRIIHDMCTKCERCIEICPAKVMILEDGYRPDEKGRTTHVIIDYDKCIKCFCCQEVCPHRAIDIKEGWAHRAVGIIRGG